MQYSVHDTNDLIMHTSKIDGWDQAYYQTTPGEIFCRLQLIKLEGFQVIIERFSHDVTQYGCVPPGSVGFAIIITGATAGNSTLQGNEFVPGSLYMVGNGQEFLTHVSGGAIGFAFTVPLEYIRELVERSSSVYASSLLKRPFLEFKTSCVDDLARIAQALCDIGSAPKCSLNEAKSHVKVAVDLFSDIFLCPSDAGQANFCNGVRSGIVRRCRDIIMAKNGGVNVNELCADLKVSRRTLQNAFNTVTGQSPLYHLRSLRLGEVKRALIARKNADVGDVAFEHGFTHLGRFAAEYKKLFGELPSVTKLRQISR